MIPVLRRERKPQSQESAFFGATAHRRARGLRRRGFNNATMRTSQTPWNAGASMPELITRRDGAVATVLFSNLPKLNAVTFDMWRAVPETLAALDADPSVRVIVVAGDGEKAFISGADISQFEKARCTAQAQAEYGKAVQAASLAPIKCSKPVIARIRGVCMGGGLGFAASCDLRICSEDAVFRMPAARLGLGYGPDGIRRFMAVLGAANAVDIFISARKFDAR